jgi:Flp pilus assembly protein TadD
MTSQEILAQALRDHQAGQWAAAEKAYRLLLGRQLNDPPVLHWLGLLYSQIGRDVEAEPLIRRAAQLSPGTADFQANLAVVLDRLNRLPEALAAFQAALKLQPNDAVVLCNFGDALRRAGRAREAVAACRQAVNLQPRFAQAHFNLAKGLAAADELEQSIAAYRAALEINPEFAEALSGLGNALRRNRQPDEAIVEFRKVVARQPDNERAHSNLGAVLLEQGRFEEGLASIQKALAIRPDLAEAHLNLGNCFLISGRNDEARAAYAQAVALRPDYGLAHHQLGWTQLLQGDFENGWHEYEWRLKVKEFRIPRPQYPRPRWDGSELAGRRILLYGEQGFGDRIQFVRYVSAVAERGGKIILADRPSLMRLYRSLETPIEFAEPDRPLLDFDAHCSLVSLPLIFGTNLATIPHTCPYLRADAQLAERWKIRLSASGPQLKIGLAWSGDPQNRNDRWRSIPLAKLAALGRIRDTEFFSLQKGDAANQAQSPPDGFKLSDWTAELGDFADTAALICALDAVVTVDTCIAHLAGALGKPTWLLLPLCCDWRWMLDRRDSPWYPTLRLSRQSRLGEWEAPIAEMVNEIAAMGSGTST